MLEHLLGKALVFIIYIIHKIGGWVCARVRVRVCLHVTVFREGKAGGIQEANGIQERK